MNRLLPCKRCSRHVRSSALVCPFCGISLEPLSAVVAALSIAVFSACTSQADLRERDRLQAEIKSTKQALEAQRRENEACEADAKRARDRMRDEEELRKLNKQLIEGRESVDLYGTPGMLDKRMKSSKKGCKCTPGDPLCSCP